MIQHNQRFGLYGDEYHYDAEAIQAYKNNEAITLKEFVEAYDEYCVKEAFGALMGINGDRYIKEIIEDKMLSQRSYDAICENIKFNSKDSVVKYFGLVHYYYLQGIK